MLITLPTPSDYDLSRDACSYGYFLLAPNYWDPGTRSLVRAFSLPKGPALVAVSQPNGRGFPLALKAARKADAAERAELSRQVTRMLRLDEGPETIREFHRLDPRFKKSGRARLFRSPTLFEDVIKTVTSCNVTWPSTVVMNRRLCEVLGEEAQLTGSHQDRGDELWRARQAKWHTFPSAERIARVRPQTLRARCRVGYRDARIIELARLFTTPPKRGGLDVRWLEDPRTPDQELHDALIELPGIGPYAAANIMQLLGRYSRLPLDTESVRHGRTVLGFRGSSERVMKRVKAHFAPFGAHAFRSYWFEMWNFYESKHGPAHTWERDSTGKLFTAAALAKA